MARVEQRDRCPGGLQDRLLLPRRSSSHRVQGLGDWLLTHPEHLDEDEALALKKVRPAAGTSTLSPVTSQRSLTCSPVAMATSSTPG
ncbi:hypothetical protein [Protofrankia symbiont of Coriaria ruscifolia]|uniref:hypothetical protein n=1 Tax=Protofrankia symbiont of Coriaria ruscifolia TaxID=1306542 RepID=UPI00104123F8|nr:hypothetical protein [Protofrankia symbiont of Coriaria ruscifolia]